MELNQTVYNSIYSLASQQIIKQIIIPALPFFASFFVMALANRVIKGLLGHGVRDLSLICGDTKRVANKHAKTAQDIYDVATSVNDIRKL